LSSSSSNNDFRRELLATAAVMVVEVVVRLAILTCAIVIDWFRSPQNQMTRSDIAFTLKNELQGEFAVVQGIFDTSNGIVKSSRQINASRVDGEMAQLHRDTNLVIYQ